MNIILSRAAETFFWEAMRTGRWLADPSCPSANKSDQNGACFNVQICPDFTLKQANMFGMIAFENFDSHYITLLVVVQKKWFLMTWMLRLPSGVLYLFWDFWAIIKLNWRGSMCWPTLLVPSMFDTHGRVQRRTRQEAKVQIFVTFTNCFCFQLTTFPGAGCCGNVLNFLPRLDAVWDRIWSRELSSPPRVLMPWIMPCACNW